MLYPDGMANEAGVLLCQTLCGYPASGPSEVNRNEPLFTCRCCGTTREDPNCTLRVDADLFHDSISLRTHLFQDLLRRLHVQLAQKHQQPMDRDIRNTSSRSCRGGSTGAKFRRRVLLLLVAAVAAPGSAVDATAAGKGEAFRTRLSTVDILLCLWFFLRTVPFGTA